MLLVNLNTSHSLLSWRNQLKAVVTKRVSGERKRARRKIKLIPDHRFYRPTYKLSASRWKELRDSEPTERRGLWILKFRRHQHPVRPPAIYWWSNIKTFQIKHFAAVHKREQESLIFSILSLKPHPQPLCNSALGNFLCVPLADQFHTQGTRFIANILCPRLSNLKERAGDERMKTQNDESLRLHFCVAPIRRNSLNLCCQQPKLFLTLFWLL